MEVKDSGNMKPNTEIKVHIVSKPRRPLAFSLGPILKCASPCMPACDDQWTTLQGAISRFLKQVGIVDEELLLELIAFVTAYVRKYRQIPRGEISLENYLSTSNYTMEKKEKFRKLKEKQIGMPRRPIYRSFGKQEFINVGANHNTMLKTCRCINGPEDRWKVFVNPLMHAVEEVVCHDEEYAKHIPVHLRPRAVLERMGHLPGPYYTTDYSSFEASITAPIINAVENVLYKHVLANYADEVDHITKQLVSRRTLKFRGFTVRCDAVRMSGDANTSLGNGFTNLMLMKFLAHKQGLIVTGFVEGDDGLFVYNKPPDFGLIARLGFELKAEKHDNIYDTSFCGMMLSQSLAVFADPIYEIVKFGWSASSMANSRKDIIRRGLLRAKALSLFYCHPRCPVITALAARFIDLTSGVEPIFSKNYWELQMSKGAKKFSDQAQAEFDRGITIQDRVDFNKLYNIDPQTQMAFEKYVSRVSDLDELDHWSIDEMLKTYTILIRLRQTHTT
jgi:hypothetical protein